MMPRGDWKSAAADRLQRMGQGDSAKALYGIKARKHRRREEMTSSQLREKGKRRSGNAHPKSLFARFRAWFNL